MTNAPIYPDKMYTIKTGKLAGRTMEHAILRWPHRLYPIATWAEGQVEEKPRLRPLVHEFHRLRERLRRARIHARCREEKCKKKARFMTFEQATGSGYLPFPFWWCRKHGPGDHDFESQKMPIDFSAMELFSTVHEKRIFCGEIRKALGIKKGTRITETFAHRFFAQLDLSDDEA